MDFTTKDEDILATSSDDNHHFQFQILYIRYRRLINYWVYRFCDRYQRLNYLDASQIALIAFFKAICSYTPGNCKFITYAKKGITLALISEIRVVYRDVGTISLDDFIQSNNEGETLAETLPDDLSIFQPEKYYLVNEQIERLDGLSRNFNDLKRQIHQLRIDGFSNGEIAAKLNLSKRQVEYQVKQIRQLLQKVKTR